MIVAGTGHRPDKLGGYSDDAFNKLERIAYNWLHTNRPERVISGGALGWDQALAQAALYDGIPLTLALPFPKFWIKWPKKSQDYLELLVSQADKVVYVCEEGYAAWKMQARNKWMVDNCQSVLALWNGTDGGTANCVRYAEQTGRPIINLWKEFNEEVNRT